MTPDTKPRIGITHGDTNGIGYEIILKTLEDQRILELCTPIVYGSGRMATYHRKGMNLAQVNFVTREDASEALPDEYTIINVVPDDVKIDLGQPTQAAGQAAFAALERATADLRDGKIDALVTAPINKRSIQSDTFVFVEKIKALDTSLRRDFGIVRPRIAVLSLNPHAGEQNLLGTEESEIISPAIFDAASEKIGAFGPYAADGFFGSGQWKHFDGVLAMYHDQGLAPFKTIAMDSGVNFTAGLPFVRTSPDHGTGYDIAGQGIASPDSMRAAIYEAIDIARRRDAHTERTANPLAKHYHERSRHDASVDLSKSDD
ncbi:MAG: 4-hydroxythreonine-4-phosphate dehydrogenase PdxA [Muribaculaceae bacterium]|nr:4-hydroxythreonine-4-phosphate dehydrogenase PdxA [Muribaculaceae bacterium]